MWICLIGPPSCKNQIASDLSKQFNYRHAEVLKPLDKCDAVISNVDLLCMHYRQSIECSKTMHNENIVTVSSFWTQHLVYSKALLKCSLINEYEFKMSEHLYRSGAVKMEPPSLFVYLPSSHINISNRFDLKGDEGSEDWINYISEYHSEFVKDIRIPVVEIRGDQEYSEIWENIKFEVDQMRTSRASDQTLWTRTMFHSGYI